MAWIALGILVVIAGLIWWWRWDEKRHQDVHGDDQDF